MTKKNRTSRTIKIVVWDCIVAESIFYLVTKLVTWKVDRGILQYSRMAMAESDKGLCVQSVNNRVVDLVANCVPLVNISRKQVMTGVCKIEKTLGSATKLNPARRC